MSVWEPKGRDGLPHISSGMCPVTTERFNNAVLLAPGGCGCLSVCSGRRSSQAASGRQASSASGLGSRRSAVGRSAVLPACGEEVV